MFSEILQINRSTTAHTPRGRHLSNHHLWTQKGAATQNRKLMKVVIPFFSLIFLSLLTSADFVTSAAQQSAQESFDARGTDHADTSGVTCDGAAVWTIDTARFTDPDSVDLDSE